MIAPPMSIHTLRSDQRMNVMLDYLRAQPTKDLTAERDLSLKARDYAHAHGQAAHPHNVALAILDFVIAERMSAT